MTTSALHQALAGQTVVVLGGSSGIGLETAHQARSADARVILTGRRRDRLDRAAHDVDAMGTAMLDLGRPEEIESFFTALPAPVDHVLVSGGGPPYAALDDIDFDDARRVLDEHLLGALRVARACSFPADRINPRGSAVATMSTRVGVAECSVGPEFRSGHCPPREEW